MKVVAIFTCFNRREKTENCIKTLVSGNPKTSFEFVVVDDNSNDGTQDALRSLSREYLLHLIEGNGSLFYSGGMRVGMQYALDKMNGNYDYMLVMNDDVDFMAGSIEKIIKQSQEQNDAVIVGAMCSRAGKMTYGAVKYTKGIKFITLSTEEWQEEADTFNANCVLIPFKSFRDVGAMDSNYKHSLGDFDYGLALKKKGYKIHISKEYCGYCERNAKKGTWLDTSLSRKERIKIKESIKGAPTKQWFYFLKKNFGLGTAIKASVTPYIRIFIGK